MTVTLFMDIPDNSASQTRGHHPIFLGWTMRPLISWSHRWLSHIFSINVQYIDQVLQPMIFPSTPPMSSGFYGWSSHLFREFPWFSTIFPHIIPSKFTDLGTVNYSISLTWSKVIWGSFPSVTMIPGLACRANRRQAQGIRFEASLVADDQLRQLCRLSKRRRVSIT